MESVNSIMLFPFSLSLPIKQMRQVCLRAHLQPGRYPGQRHGRLLPQPPSNGQFLDNEVKLARFEQRAPTLEEKGEVRMASAPVVAEPARKIEAPVVQASVHEAAPAPRNPLVHQASLTMPASKLEKAAAVSVEPVKLIRLASADTAPARPARPEAKASHIDAGLAQQIAAAAKLESSHKAR